MIHALFASIGFYFLIFSLIIIFHSSLQINGISYTFSLSEGNKPFRDPGEGEARHWWGHWDPVPETGCLAHSWNWISVRICWFFTKRWSLNFRLLARTKYKAWRCVWPKLELFRCGEIWGQNWNPILLPQLKPLKIVPHCGFWDSEKRQFHVVYYTRLRKLLGI